MVSEFLTQSELTSNSVLRRSDKGSLILKLLGPARSEHQLLEYIYAFPTSGFIGKMLKKCQFLVARTYQVAKVIVHLLELPTPVQSGVDTHTNIEFLRSQNRHGRLQ